MLPSLGYLKSITCPFHQSGLCERPYCHFRHVRRVSNPLESQTSNSNEYGKSDSSVSKNNKAKEVGNEGNVNYDTSSLSSIPCYNTSKETKDAEKIRNCWSVPSMPHYRPTPIKKLKQLNGVNEGENGRLASYEPTPISKDDVKILEKKKKKIEILNNDLNDKKFEEAVRVVNESLSSYTLNTDYDGKSASSDLPNNGAATTLPCGDNRDNLDTKIELVPESKEGQGKKRTEKSDSKHKESNHSKKKDRKRSSSESKFKKSSNNDKKQKSAEKSGDKFKDKKDVKSKVKKSEKCSKEKASSDEKSKNVTTKKRKRDDDEEKVSSKRLKSKESSSSKKSKSNTKANPKKKKVSSEKINANMESKTALTEEDGANFINTLKKKRTAHQPSTTRPSGSAPPRRAKISPAEVMHNRFMQMQDAIDKQKESIGAASDSKRLAGVPSSMLSAIQAKCAKKPADTNGIPLGSQTGTSSNIKGSKRVAHLPPQSSFVRPRIPTSFGSKVPSNVRQRYLNLFIDECLKIYPSEKDASDRALEEEKSAYDRSTNKSVYLNVAVNIMKKLRGENKNSTLQNSSKNGAKTSKTKTTPKAFINAVSHEYNLGGAKAAKISYSIERTKPKANVEVGHALFYEQMKTYLLTEEQLVENSYPRNDKENEGRAVVHNIDDIKRIPSDKSLDRICSRCHFHYKLNDLGLYIKRQQCIFHWGRLHKQRVDGDVVSTYSCCQGDRETEGCSVAKGHVDDRIDSKRLDGFVETYEKNEKDDELRVYAIDCEMCYSAVGMELTRVTVIDRKLDTIYETLVKPSRPIIDYNTRFSGINEKDLKGVKVSLVDVQNTLLDMFSCRTILMGHSLNSDLFALKIVHSFVVDTAIVFPHRRGPPFKRALKNIMVDYLMKIIQNDVDGHDSNEDAKSCMELMVWKIKEDSKNKKKS